MTDCLFCRIATREIPATVVTETEQVLAFRDIDPQAPTHILVIPKVHSPDVGALAVEHPGVLVDLVATCREVARAEGVGDAFRLVFNTGAGAGQSVFHVHGHVLGGRPFGWPPG